MTHSLSFLYNFIDSQKLRNETLHLFFICMRAYILPVCITRPPHERGKRGFPRKLDLRQIPFSPAASNPWFTLQILRSKPIARFLRDLHSSAGKMHYVILCRRADILWSCSCFVVHPMPWANCDGSCDYLKGFNRSDYSIKYWPLGSHFVWPFLGEMLSQP